MPSFYRRRRRRRRRPLRRRRRSRRFRGRRRFYRRGRRYGTISVPRQIIPNMAVVRLPFVTNVRMDLTAADKGIYQLRANGPFDPDVAFGGQQPYGYDQWADFYRTYTVLASRIAVTFTLKSASVQENNIVVGMSLQRGNQMGPYLALSNVNILEHPATVNRNLQFYSARPSITTLRYKYKASNFWRRKTLTDGEQEAETSTVPVNQAYFGFFAVNTLGGIGETAVVHAQVKIWYTIAFRHPRILPGS